MNSMLYRNATEDKTTGFIFLNDAFLFFCSVRRIHHNLEPVIYFFR